MKKDGIHTSNESFGEEQTEEQIEKVRTEQLKTQLKDEMRKNLAKALEELEDGTLHGLVIVRVNDEHGTAGSIALCNQSATRVAGKLQDLAMELMMTDAPPKVLGLLALLRKLEKSGG